MERRPCLPALSVLPILAWLGFAGFRPAAAPAAGPTPPPAALSPARGGAPDAGRPGDASQVSRWETQKGLETAYEDLAMALDSLRRDSLAVPAGMRDQYRRILREARTAKDNTAVHLEELRVSAQGVTPEIWEEIRARTEFSLDSLRRLILSADSMPGSTPPPIPADAP